MITVKDFNTRNSTWYITYHLGIYYIQFMDGNRGINFCEIPHSIILKEGIDFGVIKPYTKHIPTDYNSKQILRYIYKWFWGGYWYKNIMYSSFKRAVLQKKVVI